MRSRSCRCYVCCSFSCSDKRKLHLSDLFQSLSSWSFFFLMMKIILISLKIWNRRKLVAVAGKQMAGVACFWELYLVAELCKRWVTFSAVYTPCRKGSAVEFCTSAALVFSIFVAVLVQNCKVMQPVFFSSYRWSFTGMHALHAASCAVQPCQAPA